jgi:hypothetical protein
MATAYKVLGQVEPSANTLTTAYTVPSSTQAVISTIAVCNLGSGPTTYRIAVRPDGETIADKHYIAYDSAIAPQDTIALTIGITLGDTDVVSVESFSGTVSFNLFGSEIS